MILAVAATEFEMASYLQASRESAPKVLICGVGVLESCLALTRYLEKNQSDISAVVHFGVAGAYVSDTQTLPAMLDICIAEREVFGDLGICYPRRLDELGEELALQKNFSLDESLRAKALAILRTNDINAITGSFVTVSCVSGTSDRGEILRSKYNGICENMEGAAIARVCLDFSLPCVEIRCISNYVEDRDQSRWRLEEACNKAGEVAALVVGDLG
jgi:futalosine hydrolase